ncbi:MAG: hypothetical protein OWQ50_07555 [Acidianus infernus]|nr:hypothetical protein [Acidianus infernus]
MRIRIEEVAKASSVNELFDKARITYKNTLDKCKEEYKIEKRGVNYS